MALIEHTNADNLEQKDVPAGDKTTILSRLSAGKPVYKRHHIKSDGRSLLLYGYKQHDLPILAKDVDVVSTGGELRYHPLRKEWAVYAAHRQNRTFKPSSADDPLAPMIPNGSWTEIPFEDFELAIFDNKFTSFHPDAPLPQTRIEGVETATAAGKCEVIVYTTEGSGSLATLGQEKRRLLVHAWIDRYEALYNAGNAFVMPFESRGDEVGVTLHHPHGQIYAFPFIPAVQQNAATVFAEGFDLAGLLPSWEQDYAIVKAGGMMSFAPPFARFPYEVWIAPQTAKAGPWLFNDEEIDGFAELLGDVTRRYDAFFGRTTPYMLTLHAAPAGYEDSFQFSAQFYPLLRSADKVKYLASVEQGTNVFTVDIMPEMTADTLRKY